MAYKPTITFRNTNVHVTIVIVLKVEIVEFVMKINGEVFGLTNCNFYNEVYNTACTKLCL